MLILAVFLIRVKCALWVMTKVVRLFVNLLCPAQGLVYQRLLTQHQQTQRRGARAAGYFLSKPDKN